jgi:hypothetical protein
MPVIINLSFLNGGLLAGTSIPTIARANLTFLPYNADSLDPAIAGGWKFVFDHFSPETRMKGSLRQAHTSIFR